MVCYIHNELFYILLFYWYRRRFFKRINKYFGFFSGDNSNKNVLTKKAKKNEAVESSESSEKKSLAPAEELTLHPTFSHLCYYSTLRRQQALMMSPQPALPPMLPFQVTPTLPQNNFNIVFPEATDEVKNFYIKQGLASWLLQTKDK